MAGQYYILCEGNYGQANASLWSIDESFSNAQGPLIWDVSSNPLGDVGQSLTLYENTLYIVMNNSHKIRIVNLETSPTHEGDIDLSGSSPRYFAIHNESGLGYVSSWSLGALLVIDLEAAAVIDTIQLNALPEEILIHGNNMYVSINMASDWSSDNEVWHFDLQLPQPTVVNAYTVIDGPASMALHGDNLYVTSIYYNDAWESFSGSSIIDLNDHTVTTIDHGIYQNYSADIDIINDKAYRTYGNFIVPLNEDLSFDNAGSIGFLPGIYSFQAVNDHFLVSTSDFVAPDEMLAYTQGGQFLGRINVGALPGDAIYYEADQVAIDSEMERPRTAHLTQNYPNPFNPSTSIPIRLNKSGELSLKIYDIKGGLVTTLIDGPLNAGEYTSFWNGLNSQGLPVSSGLYHAILSSGSLQQHIKMSLIH